MSSFPKTAQAISELYHRYITVEGLAECNDDGKTSLGSVIKSALDVSYQHGLFLSCSNGNTIHNCS